MGYRNLQACVADLERTGQLRRIDVPVQPHLELAEIQRRACRKGGPALLFTNVVGCRFPVLANLYATIDRMRFLFRDTLPVVKQLVALRTKPEELRHGPWKFWRVPFAGLDLLARRRRSGPALANRVQVADLPALTCWPRDGGPFVTLPQVYSEDVTAPGWPRGNLGMYRVQLSGNEYRTNAEVGLHYQLHRGIGVHHAKALAAGKPFHVNVSVGGPPSLAIAAVMPLPEGLPEMSFAGALSGRAIRLAPAPETGLAMPAEADFCIVGTVDPARQLPEGPFGDHLGYYALTHEFPVLNVQAVYHRPGAIWPFTSVGRPPQEDSVFGEFIHELVGPLIPAVLPGVKAVHAVDAAGVHPLLLAVASERYVPYGKRQPREILTAANAILGQGQLSLAKFLFIAAAEDDPALDPHDIMPFLQHVLRRFDGTRDLHFQTRTTIDTLDYSGDGLNEGSKVVVAAAGEPIRELPTSMPSDVRLPAGFGPVRMVAPGIAAVGAPRFVGGGERDPAVAAFVEGFPADHPLRAWPLLVLCDDPAFVAATPDNFLWTAFTRSNPAADLHGIDAFTHRKHWGCRGPLVLDARAKPHHAPALEQDPAIVRRVDDLAAGPLRGLID